MTPIVIPLAETSDWSDPDLMDKGEHQELKYLMRSAIENVDTPHFIIVGHLPLWLLEGTFKKEGISSSYKVTHLAWPDDPDLDKDLNMMRKVNRACEHLKQIGHTKGFIRASDDQLFLNKYQPGIYHRGFIQEYFLYKIAVHNAQKSNEELPMNSWEMRLANTGSVFDKSNKRTALLFDIHVPQWYLSADSWINAMEQLYELELPGETGVTINSFYYNAIQKELFDQPIEIQTAVAGVENRKIQKNPDYILVDNKIDPDLRIIGVFRQGCEKAKFLSYNRKGIRDKSGTLKRFIQSRFPKKYDFEL